MDIQNIFDSEGAGALVSRIEQLHPDSQPLWGKMNASQMLAHCSRPFEMVFDPTYTQKHPRPNAFMRFMLKLMVKPIVVGLKPYKKNIRTAPEFIIDDERDFTTEKTRLIDFIQQTHQTGAAEFEGKESPSFGPLTAKEWNILFYKHTDHHLAQFGV